MVISFPFPMSPNPFPRLNILLAMGDFAIMPFSSAGDGGGIASGTALVHFEKVVVINPSLLFSPFY